MFTDIFHFLSFEVFFHWRSSSFQVIVNLSWLPKLEFQIWERSNQGFTEIFRFQYLRSSSIGGCLYFKQWSILLWVPKFKFQIWGRSDQGLMSYSTVNMLLRYFAFSILRSSSIGGWLHFKQWSILVWVPKFKFQIWGRSVQGLMSYSTLNILRS